MAVDQSFPSSPCLEDGKEKLLLLQDELYIKYKESLEKVRRLLNQDEFNNLPLLIDIIQGLAIGHHFSKEIQAILHRQFMDISQNNTRFSTNDLYTVSLHFRLLRQAGFPITQDVFISFLDENEKKFKKELGEDTKGLLALYEAAHLGFEEEDILEEAARFTTQILCSNQTRTLGDRQHQMEKHTMKSPSHKSMAKLIAKSFIENDVCEDEQVIIIKDLARMEFNVTKSLFQEEVLQVVKWWDGLELTRELELARDQPMKWHMWSMSVLLDPSLSWHRVLLTKPISLVYIVDDIFDIYGTLDQLELFTQTIKRWDFCEADGLPNYMKMCFNAIRDTTYEISHIVYQEHGFNPLDILKRSWEILFDAFLKEAKWFASGHLPNAQEYLNNGILSTGVPMALSHLFFIIGEDIASTKTQTMLYQDHDSILYLVGMILRLYDDMGNAQDEQKNGHDGSYLKCYMNEYGISSHEVAKKHFLNMVSSAWKKLNKRCLSKSNSFPPSFTRACLNVARMVPIVYNKSHRHELNALKECFTSAL